MISKGGLHVRLQNARHWPKIERVGGDWCADILWSSTLSHEKENKRTNEKSDTRSYEIHARSWNMNEILQESDKK